MGTVSLGPRQNLRRLRRRAAELRVVRPATHVRDGRRCLAAAGSQLGYAQPTRPLRRPELVAARRLFLAAIAGQRRISLTVPRSLAHTLRDRIHGAEAK